MQAMCEYDVWGNGQGVVIANLYATSAAAANRQARATWGTAVTCTPCRPCAGHQSFYITGLPNGRVPALYAANHAAARSLATKLFNAAVLVSPQHPNAM